MQNTSQHPVSFHRIRQRKVIQLLGDHRLGHTHEFARLTSWGYDRAVHDTYNHHIKKFIVHDRLDRVWNYYKTVSPEHAWNSDMLSFGVLYSKKNNSLIYTGDEYPGIEEGQIIFINIKLLGGLLNLAVAHHIVEVNEEEKIIHISYLEKGTSEGSQWIRFIETPEGFTEITHETRYKSKSRFRDKNLYPVLHEKAISQFHRNVKNRLAVVK